MCVADVMKPDRLKSAFSHIFRRSYFKNELNQCASNNDLAGQSSSNEASDAIDTDEDVPVHRALPPIPRDSYDEIETPAVRRKDDLFDYAASIERVKDYGWYWGPISGVAAEKLLENEPDGSFVVRDSSNDNYIFSISFKSEGSVRHVRIEQDQGNFSFGCSATRWNFRSKTIVEFIEEAVAHCNSGRYLFFLHRSAVLDPTRVQLMKPVSRFQRVQSLQHCCRFVILKCVRRDLINQLPLPPRLISYLNSPYYYSEGIE